MVQKSSEPVADMVGLSHDLRRVLAPSKRFVWPGDFSNQQYHHYISSFSVGKRCWESKLSWPVRFRLTKTRPFFGAVNVWTKKLPQFSGLTPKMFELYPWKPPVFPVEMTIPKHLLNHHFHKQTGKPFNFLWFLRSKNPTINSKGLVLDGVALPFNWVLPQTPRSTKNTWTWLVVFQTTNPIWKKLKKIKLDDFETPKVHRGWKKTKYVSCHHPDVATVSKRRFGLISLWLWRPYYLLHQEKSR